MPDAGTSVGGGDIVNVLKPTELGNELRGADYAKLKAVLSQMRTNLEVSSVAVVQLRRVVRRQDATPRERAQKEVAFDEVQFREQALRDSIAKASTAPAEVAAAFQAQVAADYEAYARAVTAAETAARSGSSGATYARTAAE